MQTTDELKAKMLKEIQTAKAADTGFVERMLQHQLELDDLHSSEHQRKQQQMRKS